jgi:predicted nucleotidyltransferase
MTVDREILRRVRELFGDRLLGLFAFGSRVAGSPRPDSDLDLGVWMAGRIRRRDTWLPWIRAFEHEDPALDPTFFTHVSLDAPPPWLLEAVRAGVEVWFDPSGALAERLAATRQAIDEGTYRRRLFMGLPYYERVSS